MAEPTTRTIDPRVAEYLARVGIPAQALDGWTITEAFRAGQSVGFVMSCGPEVHILPTVDGRAMSRKNIREFVAPLLEKYCYVTTRVPRDVADHKLREHLGFRYQWMDEKSTFWALTTLPYERKPK